MTATTDQIAAHIVRALTSRKARKEKALKAGTERGRHPELLRQIAEDVALCDQAIAYMQARVEESTVNGTGESFLSNKGNER